MGNDGNKTKKEINPFWYAFPFLLVVTMDLLKLATFVPDMWYLFMYIGTGYYIFQNRPKNSEE